MILDNYCLSSNRHTKKGNDFINASIQSLSTKPKQSNINHFNFLNSLTKKWPSCVECLTVLSIPKGFICIESIAYNYIAIKH